MDNLDALESQSIFILREAYNKIEKLAMLWSIVGAPSSMPGMRCECISTHSFDKSKGVLRFLGPKRVFRMLIYLPIYIFS